MVRSNSGNQLILYLGPKLHTWNLRISSVTNDQKIITMKSISFIVLTVVKAGLIIYSVARIASILSKRNDPCTRRKALKQFLVMFGGLFVLTLLEFGIELIAKLEG